MRRSDRPRARLAGASFAAVVAACLPQLSIPTEARISCRTGSDCPAPLVCLDSARLCVDPHAACVDVDTGHRDADPVSDGALCTTSDGEVGICRAGRCGGACGDGVIDGAAGELCDNGTNNDDGAVDACREDCLPARCGDGVVDSAESCDEDSGDCDACMRVCALQTMDADGAAGCEAPLTPARETHGYAVGAVFAVGSAGQELLYVSVAGAADEIRRLELASGADTLVVRPAEFVTELAVSDAGVAFIAGSFAELYFLPDGATQPELVVDQVQTFVLSDAAIFVVRTDGYTEFLSRIDLVTRVETRLDDAVSYPAVLALTPTRVVWSRASGALAARELVGGATTLVADGIVEVGRLVADGETLWAIDYLGDVWRIGSEGAIRVALRPPSLAGTLGTSIAARGERWAVAYWFGGEALDFEDDEGTLITGDTDGVASMRARAAGSFSAVTIDDDGVWFAGDGVYRVAP